jgi:hypothetical protein
LHEVKFDGWRIQLHKQGRLVEIYTKGGYRCARKFELIAAALTHLPVSSCIIDGELTACDEYGLPNFHALHFHNARTERAVCGRSISSTLTAVICASAPCRIVASQAPPREACVESLRRMAALLREL